MQNHGQRGRAVDETSKSVGDNPAAAPEHLEICRPTRFRGGNLNIVSVAQGKEGNGVEIAGSGLVCLELVGDVRRSVLLSRIVQHLPRLTR